MGTNELVYKMEIELQMYKKILMVMGAGGREGEDKLGD